MFGVILIHDEMKKIFFFLISTVYLTVSGQAQAKIKFDETVYEFGVVKEGEIASHTFRYTNVGDQPLYLIKVKPSCGCTTPSWPKDTLKPGESSTIVVNYNSKGRSHASGIGPFYKTIAILSNAAPENSALYIKGVVLKTDFFNTDTPTSGKLIVSSNHYHFGTIEKGKPRKYKITLKNEGKDTLAVFGIAAGCNCVSTKSKVFKLASGESKTVELTYIPRTIGHLEERVVIVTSDNTNPFKVFTITANVAKTLVKQSIINEGGTMGF